MSRDGENHVYNDDRIDSKYIRQLERNPHLETTIRATLNPKHINVCARVIQEATSNISQTVRCQWHVRRWGRVRLSTRESFGRICCRKVTTIAIVILLDALHETTFFR